MGRSHGVGSVNKAGQGGRKNLNAEMQELAKILNSLFSFVVDVQQLCLLMPRLFCCHNTHALLLSTKRL